jgi:murein DD-endopeptidase MepM/ murein hydrolase activator NlpD
MRTSIYAVFLILFSNAGFAQKYPQGYFRNPLNIPMQLVANFGEIRANHWHMGLDIRTKQRVNLPVYAAADGYVARVSVEPGGFGQAIYINHPNGFTTLYGHMNGFFPALAQYVKSRQYEAERWNINVYPPEGMFRVKKGDYIGLSGNTGASAGPHVHFEIRDTKTEKCLNPLLFKFPIADAVPPTVARIAMYDRNRPVYAQRPQFISAGTLIKVGSDKISFAIGATDRFSGSNNPNGIYAASMYVDDELISSFVHDNIGYDETRYLNAQVDYKYGYNGGADLQHISPLPGAATTPYQFEGDGMLHLNDTGRHKVVIRVSDANGNLTTRAFTVQYDPSLAITYTDRNEKDRFLPNNVNVFERDAFEIFTTERTIYDTVDIIYSENESGGGTVSKQFSFLHPSIPSHDSFTVRIMSYLNESSADRVIIKNVSGKKTFIKKATWQNGWLSAKFRQFGTFVAIIDDQPPTVNAPATNLSKAGSISFTPRDNFNVIKNFRVELDGKWLRFTNDKGRTWTYSFDEHFPRGEHELKVIVEDEAGNVTVRTWNVRR